MCLDRITGTLSRNNEVIEAWKIFNSSWKPDLHPTEFYTSVKNYPINLGRWNICVGRKLLYSGDYKKYVAGFHTFATLEAAQKYGFPRQLILPVEIRDVRVVGVDMGFKCYVSKQLRISKNYRYYMEKHESIAQITNSILDELVY